MPVAWLRLTFHAPWVHSLKEKRMVVNSLRDKLRHRFNASVAEADCQDLHQTVVIEVAALAANKAQADSYLDSITRYAASVTDAELVEEEREFLYGE